MLNEPFGWVLIFAALGLGLYMGVKFQREDWLGGYSSFPRRMVRLAHVAMAALGALNILFTQTAPHLHLGPSMMHVASFAFIIGAVTMPLSCLWLAFQSRIFNLFAFPVGCLATGLILTIGGLVR